MAYIISFQTLKRNERIFLKGTVKKHLIGITISI